MMLLVTILKHGDGSYQSESIIIVILLLCYDDEKLENVRRRSTRMYFNVCNVGPVRLHTRRNFE